MYLYINVEISSIEILFDWFTRNISKTNDFLKVEQLFSFKIVLILHWVTVGEDIGDISHFMGDC